MREEIAKALTDGLVNGYAGQSNISDIERATFVGESSHSEIPGGIYHDEWFVPTHLGGGQELVRVGDTMFTRLYGGGTPPSEKLAELGITKDQVGEYLIRKIVELGDRTRLVEECLPEPDEEWQYSYKILLKDSDTSVVVAVESIAYQQTQVHLHPFILSPVK